MKKSLLFGFMVVLIVAVCCIVFGVSSNAIADTSSDDYELIKEPPKDFSLEEISQDTQLRTDSLPSYISTIIEWVLGILGVILVALIVYGGVQYMTSAGDEKRIESAKRILTYAIIGAVVVFAAFIISRYVISALVSGGDSDAQNSTSTTQQPI